MRKALFAPLGLGLGEGIFLLALQEHLLGLEEDI